jgi:NADH-quinone oxidoreductase subunit M
MLSTSLYHRSGTFEMPEMGGLVRKAPVLAGFFVTAMMASIAVPGPGLANFWGEFAVFVAVWNWKSWVLVPAALGVILSAVYGLRAVGRIFFGQPTDAFAARLESGIVDLRWGERLPALILFAMLIGIGVWPRSISDGVNDALESSLPVATAAAAAGDGADRAAVAVAR